MYGQQLWMALCMLGEIQFHHDTTTIDPGSILQWTQKLMNVSLLNNNIYVDSMLFAFLQQE